MRRAACDRCGRVAWVNLVTPLDAPDDRYREFCAECFERVPHVEPRRNRTAKCSGANHNDPGWDNAVRAMEGDW